MKLYDQCKYISANMNKKFELPSERIWFVSMTTETM